MLSPISYVLQRGIILRQENPTYTYWRGRSLQRRVVLKWFYSPRVVETILSEVHALYRVPFSVVLLIFSQDAGGKSVYKRTLKYRAVDITVSDKSPLWPTATVHYAAVPLYGGCRNMTPECNAISRLSNICFFKIIIIIIFMCHHTTESFEVEPDSC